MPSLNHENDRGRDILQHIFDSLGNELWRAGAVEDRNITSWPTLTNDIHPLFRKERWLRGHEQRIDYVWERLLPAIRLASLWITEPCTLAWFHHVGWGHRGRDQKGRVYIHSTRTEQTERGKQRTVDRLRQMAYTLTFFFMPKACEEQRRMIWGVTWFDMRYTGFAHLFRRQDFPSFLGQGTEHATKPRIVIGMNQEFQDFFLYNFDNVDPSEYYRVMYMFAGTLVHETAHAYYMWMERVDNPNFPMAEPLWSKYEVKPELGFSWESITLGHICNPINNLVARNMGPLSSVYNEAWRRGENPLKNLKDLVDVRGMAFTELPIQDHDALPSMDWRGNQWSWVNVQDRRINYQCVMHAIPMRWIANWFSETFWARLRAAYARGEYATPPLGPSLVVWYERRDGVARCFYGIRDEDPWWKDLENQKAEMELY